MVEWKLGFSDHHTAKYLLSNTYKKDIIPKYRGTEMVRKHFCPQGCSILTEETRDSFKR
jgi:hypothetical protein